MSTTTALARYLLPDTASAGADGRLSVGGVDLVELAEERGTPLFVYDEAHLRARCREAVEAFGPGVAYGSKAFLCLAMARLVHEEGMQLDVATGGELHVALAAGVPPERLVAHGNNKSVAELRKAHDLGVRVVVDSFEEIDRLEVLHQEDGRATTVMVRVTPGVEAHTHEYVMTGQVDSKFGFGLASGDAARAVGADRFVAGVRPGRAARPHRQPDLPAPLLREGGGGAGRVRRPARPARAVPGRGTGRGRTSTARTLPPSASGPRCSRTPAGPPASTPG